MRSKGWAAAASVLLALAGGGAWMRLRRPAPPAKAAAPDPSRAVYEGPEVMLSGRIEALKTVLVGAPIDGAIEEFDADIGQEVFEGQLLARIRNAAIAALSDDALSQVESVKNRLGGIETMLIGARLEASRARSEATRLLGDRERLERAFERQKMLMHEGATPRLVYEKSERDYSKAKADCDSLDSIAQAAEQRVSQLQLECDSIRKLAADKQADAEQAKAHLDAGEVHSPVDGIVVARRGQAGDEVTPAVKDLVEIAIDVSQLKVVLNPEPPVLRRLRGGEPALVQIPELQYPSLPGQVRGVAGDRVTVEFAAPDPQIRPGLNAQVRIRLM